MKHNMDLIRKILLRMNEHEHGYVSSDLYIDGFSDNQVRYHCLILDEAGLIEAVSIQPSGETGPTSVRLTWEGHEFIDKAQNGKAWYHTSEAVSKLGGVSFSVWASVLSQVVMQNVKTASKQHMNKPFDSQQTLTNI